MASVLRCFRGSYRWHATEGFHGNKGEPSGSSIACKVRQADTRRERPDDLAEVRLADSTRRSGEPATWGSGQRKVSRSTETWAPYNGRIRPSMQREEPPAMGTELERIAAKARCEPKLRF